MSDEWTEGVFDLLGSPWDDGVVAVHQVLETAKVSFRVGVVTKCCESHRAYGKGRKVELAGYTLYRFEVLSTHRGPNLMLFSFPSLLALLLSHPLFTKGLPR